ncbi:MAG TPA: CPBP family intramembrane glutamic endopeptidase [Candidatus Binataceae bacterium]|nr:CPBP family intramembrane glutamic endopeptidase [Candidatus Binataceae bacterium]
MSFTARLTVAIVGGIIIALLIAPLVAVVTALAGWHFPFPRIFDRVAMVTVVVALLSDARGLHLISLLRDGFARPAKNTGRVGRGFAVGVAMIAVLLVLAELFGSSAGAAIPAAASSTPKYLLSAIVIAIIEEGFFRALVCGGMQNDLGRGTAIALSSLIYALAHVLRSPARFFVASYQPAAGLRTIEGSVAQLSNPAAVLATVVGLFLLGVVLATAFVETRTVYFGAGLHAAVVVGAKLWPKLVVAPALLPAWVAGWGTQPLISGAAAWLLALVVLALVRPLAGASRPLEACVPAR